MRRLLAAPLVHFLLLGGALVAGRGWWARDAVAGRPRIVIGAGDLERLRATWAAMHGGPPDAAAEAGLVRDALDEEVLYREAVAAGFDRGDAAVRERLVRLGGFVGEEGAADREELEREARRLGLARSDVVIRRHLVEMMRLALARPAADDAPSEAELEAYLARHAEELAAPATVTLTHVYLSAAARGAALAGDAAALLAALRAGEAGAARRGDPFIRGARIGPASRDDLERMFGAAFAQAIDGAPVGTWVGPVASPFGLHLVRVLERRPGDRPALERVRSRIVLGVREERGTARAAERLAALRARYDVVVDGAQ